MFRLLWSHHQAKKHVARFQCITFNVIFGSEHQYTIVLLDCGFSFYLVYYTLNGMEYTRLKKLYTKIWSAYITTPRSTLRGMRNVA
jgi:hypothetical protein